MVFICPWVKRTGVQEFLRDIPAGSKPYAEKFLRLLLECSNVLTFLNALNESGTKVYNKIHAAILRAKKKEFWEAACKGS